MRNFLSRFLTPSTPEPPPVYSSEEQQRVEKYLESLEAEISILQDIIKDDRGWRKINQEQGTWDFTRERLKEIVALSRLYYLRNPLCKRAVEVQCHYVFALGFTVKAAHDQINKCIQAFWNDDQNKAELTSYNALMMKDRTEQIDGNLFFVFFVSRRTGRVKVRTINSDQIEAIETDPDDYRKPRWYLRVVPRNDQTEPDREWYPDWHFRPDGSRPQGWKRGDRMFDDVPMCHKKSGGLDCQQFGVPSMYSAFDWIRAYVRFLENWATIMRAYARVAMQISGAKKGTIAAAKDTYQTSIGQGIYGEDNPSPIVGSTFAPSGGVEISAVKTAGATTPAEDGKPIKLMFIAAAGLPDTFFGDSDSGNFATATTLDRPTELKMVARQKEWDAFFSDVHDFVVYCSASSREGYCAPGNISPAEGEDVQALADLPEGWYDDDGPYIDFKNVDHLRGVNRTVTMDFPSILERDASERIRALVGAFTMNGRPLNDVVPDKRFICRLVLDAVGIPNAEELSNRMWPANTPEEELRIPNRDDVERELKQMELDSQKEMAQISARNRRPPNGQGS